MNSFLSPGQQGESLRDDTLGIAPGNGLATPTSQGERDKKEIEEEIREALFRNGASPQAPQGRKSPYKGRPLQGAWAATGQTGALVVGKQGEPVDS